MTHASPPPNATRPRRITRELLFAAFAGPSTEADDQRILDRMSSAIEEQRLKPGDVLFREGEAAVHVHFMSEGRMRLTRAGSADWVYEGRWVVGTTDVLAGRPRARSAIMETQAHLFRLPSELWFEVMRDRPEVLLSAISGFAAENTSLHARLGPDGSFGSAAPTVIDITDIAGKARLLAQLPVLRGVPIQVLAEIAAVAELRELAENDTLFGGTPSDRVHVVARGSVEVTRRAPDIAARFPAGSIAGGAVCLGDLEGAWSARAAEPSTVLSFGTETFFEFLGDHVDGVRAVMAGLSLERERLCDALAARLGELLLR